MQAEYISYLRVSTSSQGISGLGLEAQRVAVAQYVAGCSGLLIAEHVEVESGRLRDRPLLRAALAACRSTGATLAIAKLDRLARSVHFISGLMEARVSFVAVDMPFATPLMLHIMAAFAQHEAEMISARTKAALAAAKARGVVLGANGAKLAVANRAAAATFALTLREPMDQLRAAGAVTFQGLADGLNARGLRTREGGAWCPTKVQRVVRRLAGSKPCPAA